MRVILIPLACLMLCACPEIRRAPPVTECPTPVTLTETRYVAVPSNLTDPNPIYERANNTVGEYVTQADENTAELKKCVADKAAISTIQGVPRQ